MGFDIAAVIDQLVPELLLQVGAPVAGLRQPFDGVDHQLQRRKIHTFRLYAYCHCQLVYQSRLCVRNRNSVSKPGAALVLSCADYPECFFLVGNYTGINKYLNQLVEYIIFCVACQGNFNLVSFNQVK